MSRRRGRKDPTTVKGITLRMSRRITIPGSSTGAKTISRTVKPACEWVKIVASGRTVTATRVSAPANSSGYPSSWNASLKSSTSFSG
jgi:hypothetical protein